MIVIFLLIFVDFNPRPREEGDIKAYQIVQRERYFNPRPREEGDLSQAASFSLTSLFQSTPS